jgi:flagellar hook-basal body complex protein FliE
MILPLAAAGANAAPVPQAAPAADGGDGAGESFAAALTDAAQSAVDTGHSADAQSLSALGGEGDLSHTVAALSRAELVLQATSAIRDRVLQAYQDIIKMTI